MRYKAEIEAVAVALVSKRTLTRAQRLHFIESSESCGRLLPLKDDSRGQNNRY